MEKQENCNIRDRDTKQLCAVIRKERAGGLGRAVMDNNSARKRSTVVVLKSALAKQ